MNCDVGCELSDCIPNVVLLQLLKVEPVVSESCFNEVTAARLCTSTAVPSVVSSAPSPLPHTTVTLILGSGLSSSLQRSHQSVIPSLSHREYPTCPVKGLYHSMAHGRPGLAP